MFLSFKTQELRTCRVLLWICSNSLITWKTLLLGTTSWTTLQPTPTQPLLLNAGVLTLLHSLGVKPSLEPPDMFLMTRELVEHMEIRLEMMLSKTFRGTMLMILGSWQFWKSHRVNSSRTLIRLSSIFLVKTALIRPSLNSQATITLELDVPAVQLQNTLVFSLLLALSLPKTLMSESLFIRNPYL